MKAAKILIIVLGVIIIVLIGILFFYNPAKTSTAPTGADVVSTTQSE